MRASKIVRFIVTHSVREPQKRTATDATVRYGVTTILVVTLLASGIYYQQVVAPQQTALAGRENLRRLGVTLEEKSGLVIASLPKETTDDIFSKAVQDLAEIMAPPEPNNKLVLRLTNSSVTDLAPLEKLTNLQWLYLDRTQVSNLAPLEKLTNLQWLSFARTQVSNLASLEKLTNLHTLYLDGTQVSNLVPLEKLTNLRSLNLNATQVSNLAPLEKLNNLEQLDLSRLKNLRPEQLKAMESLQSLIVDASRVQEFERTLNRRGLVIRSSHF